MPFSSRLKIPIRRVLSPPRHRVYLFLILLFALIIRSYGITRDLPFTFSTAHYWDFVSHAQSLVLKVFGPEKLDLRHFVFRTGKYITGYNYFIFAGLFSATLLTAVWMKIIQGLPFLEAGFQATDWLVKSGGMTVAARLVSLVFALLAIYLVYRLGKEIFCREVGLIGALFLAVTPQNLIISNNVRHDIGLVFWTTVVAFFSYKIASDGKPKYYFAAGLFFGTLFTIKISAPFFVLFLFHAHFLRIRQEKADWVRIFWDERVLIAILAALAGILITFPAFFLNLEAYLHGLLITRSKALKLVGGSQVKDFSSYLRYFPIYFSEMGTWLTLICFAGGSILLLNKNKASHIIVVTPILFFAYFSSMPTTFMRWVAPLDPFLSLWAAYLVYWAIQKLKLRYNSERIHTAAVAILLGLLIIKPLSKSIEHAYPLGRPDTRLIAREWIHKNIPQDSVFASYMTHAWALPPVDLNTYGYRFVNIPYAYINVNNAIAKDRPRPLSYYRNKKVRYFILDGWHKDFHLSDNVTKKFPETAKSYQDFYREMEINSKLRYMINPQDGNYRGPRIEIYQLQDSIKD